MASTNQLEKCCERELAANDHSNPFSKVSALVRAVISFLDLGERLSTDEIIATVKTVWDNTVVAYNWPYVPEVLESRLEERAWKILEAQLKSLLDDFLDLDEQKKNEEKDKPSDEQDDSPFMFSPSI